MIGSSNRNVKTNFRALTARLLAGSGVLVLISAVGLSEAHAANELKAIHFEGTGGVISTAAHHADLAAHHIDFAEHRLADGAATHFGEAAETAVERQDIDRAAGLHAAGADAAHAAHFDGDAVDFHRAAHAAVAGRLSGDRLSATPSASASHVFHHVALRVTGDADENLPTPRAIDTGYVRSATGIDLFGAPKDWHRLAPRYGYYVSDRPVAGGVVCFAGGAYGSSDAYGFAGVVVYYRDRGAYWEVVTRYAYAGEGRGRYDDSHVMEKAFHVSKHDARARYIYRGGAAGRPAGYYARPEYVGHNVVGDYHVLSGGTQNVVAIYPAGGQDERAYVKPGQVVRVLAKAELGETLWVFVETPYRAGTVYAVTHYGDASRLVKYDGSAPEASRMYYAKDYGDTVLDLGYADYSRIAGDSGEVTITVKKGADPARLMPLQTVRLHLYRK